MNVEMPPWPVAPPRFGAVVLREFSNEDMHVVAELGSDPYIPLMGTMPPNPTAEQSLEWIREQRRRLAQGVGLSFAIADVANGKAIGTIGLWLAELSVGRAAVGYAVSPVHRGKGVARQALEALTKFAWTIPVLYRIEVRIEPWNSSSIKVAEAAGYVRERLLAEHQEIGGVKRDMLLYAMKRP